MSAFILNRWYGSPGILRVLIPLEWLYRMVVAGRRLAYARGWIRRVDLPVPVIVVGNISVGGTGKTPVVEALCRHLQARGWHPGIVSRGYASERSDPRPVQGQQAHLCGDEPLLLANRLGVPVYVGVDRVKVVQRLLQDCPQLDIVLSDDGLQHLAMNRQLEVVVLDGQRLLGNGHCLPVGPLREPASRLREKQLQLVIHGTPNACWPDASLMVLRQLPLRSVRPGDPLCFPSPPARIAAVAGVGNPARFFMQLRDLGYEVEEYPFPDHHPYSTADFIEIDKPVLMTEKDAVKCREIAPQGSVYMPVEAAISLDFWWYLDNRLETWRHPNAG